MTELNCDRAWRSLSIDFWRSSLAYFTCEWCFENIKSFMFKSMTDSGNVPYNWMESKASVPFSEHLYSLVFFCMQTIVKNMYILPRNTGKILTIIKILFLNFFFYWSCRVLVVWKRFKEKYIQKDQKDSDSQPSKLVCIIIFPLTFKTRIKTVYPKTGNQYDFVSVVLNFHVKQIRRVK